MRRFGIHGGIPRQSSSSDRGPTLRDASSGRDRDAPTRTGRRVPRLLVGLGLTTTVLVGLGSTAGAVPPPPPNPSESELDAAGTAVSSGVDRIGSLIVQIAGADQQLAELDAQVAIKREDVNRALVDLQSARDNADAAAHEVAASELALQDAGARILHAQDDFDDFARSSYTKGVNGASLASFLSTDGPDDLLDRAQVMRLLSSGRTAVLEALERARATEANSNSRARAAKLDADAAEAAAGTTPLRGGICDFDGPVRHSRRRRARTTHRAGARTGPGRTRAGSDGMSQDSRDSALNTWRGTTVVAPRTPPQPRRRRSLRRPHPKRRCGWPRTPPRERVRQNSRTGSGPTRSSTFLHRR